VRSAPPTTPGSRNSRKAIATRAAPPSGLRQEQPALRRLARNRSSHGERKWEYKYINPSTSGLLTTASNLIFSGDAEGNLLALDSRNGKLLWRYQMGATLHGTSPVTYMLDGKQQLLVRREPR